MWIQKRGGKFEQRSSTLAQGGNGRRGAKQIAAARKSQAVRPAGLNLLCSRQESDENLSCRKSDRPGSTRPHQSSGVAAAVTSSTACPGGTGTLNTVLSPASPDGARLRMPRSPVSFPSNVPW